MDTSCFTDRGVFIVTEGVEGQEVSFLYQAFFLRLDPISWSHWKGKRISHYFRKGGL